MKDFVNIIIKTNVGEISLELNKAKAPITVENFVKYIEDKFFDGTVFHRVIKNFMIQGGGLEPSLKEKDATHAPITNEAEASGLRNTRGSIAMARTDDPHSATNQFFINLNSNMFLDFDECQDGFGYTVFGEVTEGMEVVDKIGKCKTGSKKFMTDVPKDEILIESVVIED